MKVTNLEGARDSLTLQTSRRRRVEEERRKLGQSQESKP